jgi:hypothetical protein
LVRERLSRIRPNTPIPRILLPRDRVPGGVALQVGAVFTNQSWMVRRIERSTPWRRTVSGARNASPRGSDMAAFEYRQVQDRSPSSSTGLQR